MIIILLGYFNHSIQTGNLTSNYSIIFSHEKTPHERQMQSLVIIYAICIILLFCGVLQYAFCFFCEKLSTHRNASLDTGSEYSLSSLSDQVQEVPIVCDISLLHQVGPTYDPNAYPCQAYKMTGSHNDHQPEIDYTRHRHSLEHELTPAESPPESTITYFSV